VINYELQWYKYKIISFPYVGGKKLIAFYESLATNKLMKPAGTNKKCNNIKKLIDLFDGQAMANIKGMVAYDNYKANKIVVAAVDERTKKIEAQIVVQPDQQAIEIECCNVLDKKNKSLEHTKITSGKVMMVEEIACNDHRATKKTTKKRVSFEMTCNKVYVYKKIEWVD
ncbi:hypothetical protein THOM_0955, partial [Trachipleistophora hominis]